MRRSTAPPFFFRSPPGNQAVPGLLYRVVGDILPAWPVLYALNTLALSIIITSRGNDKEAIFKNDQDRLNFLNTLQHVSKR